MGKRLEGLHKGGLYFWEQTLVEYETRGYKLCLKMKDNFKLTSSMNKKVISNLIRNLMEIDSSQLQKPYC